MFCSRNSVISFFLKKRYIVNRLKNENKIFCCTYIRNDICIGKDNLRAKIANTSIRRFHSHPKYNAVDVTREDKITASHSRSGNNSEKGGKRGEVRSDRKLENYTRINEETSNMDHYPGNCGDINCMIRERQFIRKKFEPISKDNSDMMLTRECVNNSELIKYTKKKKKKKYIYIFKEFSIFSFNILANSLVDYKYDSHCSNVMDWVNRKEFIYENIIKKLSDIICLQEIEESYFIELESKLKLLHYKGLFLKKKKETCKDGICIFYNTKTFELLFFDEVIYDKSFFFKKWHVGLIVALKNLHSKRIEYYDKDTNRSEGNMSENNNWKDTTSFTSKINDIVIVSNTHLIFDSCKGDVKLYQLCYMTYRLIVMMNKCINYLKSNRKGAGTRTGEKEEIGKMGEVGKTGEADQEEADHEEADHEEADHEEADHEEAYHEAGQEEAYQEGEACQTGEYQRQRSSVLKPSIIFCGDFNITPNSLLYYYIINRYINLKKTNLKNISGQYLMFKKQYYFYSYLNGNQIRNMFEENIVNDLKYEKYNSLVENMKEESLFSFFKNEDILDAEYLINTFSENKGDYLKNYNSYEYTPNILQSAEEFKLPFKKGIMRRKCTHAPIEQARKDEEEVSREFLQFADNEGKCDRNKMEELYKADTKKERKVDNNTEKNKGEDFILYYPLYFESIYNSCYENREEKPCYKYDDIDKLNSKENNLVLSNMPFTVFHGNQKGCKISCTPFPPFDELAKYGCLPNEVHTMGNKKAFNDVIHYAHSCIFLLSPSFLYYTARLHPFQKYSASDHLYLHATLVRRTDE
ncbi:DNase I-like protein, putative [Plasmodium ovale wallikeri]|uniref:DNase I-like protein, putative n=1 Tax=Plasmodium ovale wallikeri TaxID=864142 RepID=A0A1A8Z102_PLAOA|nr:DNase I-like protein, putative [Plasmodium ovale wallikeri]